MTKISFRNRDLRICYFNAEMRIADAGLARLEGLLSQLGTVKIVSIPSLEDKGLHPCDLLIVAAAHLGDEDFPQWLRKLTTRVAQQNGIRIPCLIVAEIGFPELADSILPYAIDENWYFDVLNPNHLESLPIRVANLLRIHDHIHELDRYERTLNQLSTQVRDLQVKLETMEKESGS